MLPIGLSLSGEGIGLIRMGQKSLNRATGAWRTAQDEHFLSAGAKRRKLTFQAQIHEKFKGRNTGMVHSWAATRV